MSEPEGENNGGEETSSPPASRPVTRATAALGAAPLTDEVLEPDPGEAPTPSQSAAAAADSLTETAARTTGDPAVDERLARPGPYMTDAERRRPMVFLDKELWSDWTFRLGVLVTAICIFFPMLGSFGLWDPWEVHYGEVGRQMVERGDWISPWWGSHFQAPGKSPEGDYFFSKPVLLLWMMGIGLQIFGFSEIAIRFGVAVIALLGVCSVYLMGAKIWSRRVGLIMAGVLITSPFYFFLGRQAQTDMPFVGLMTVAMSFFMMGVFGKDRHRKVDKMGLILWFLFVLAVTVPQYHTILVGQWTRPVGEEYTWLESMICWGPVQLGFYLLLMGTVFVSGLLSKNKTRGMLYLWTFYTFIALATMGKGILGFALPGAVIFVYLVVSREWKMLGRVELARGVMIALMVGFPWYGAVLARHGGIGGAFWQRFIIHDHFKRLASGVHQIDTGSFEHFIKWLGYGLFPWGSFVPAVIARALGGSGGGSRSDQDRARMFIFIWFIIAFSLFTLASTKFHHYIFPRVPALALLVALLMEDLIAGKLKFQTYWPMYVAAGVLFILVGFDLMSDPQHLKNLFTYKYDRRWDHEAWDPGFKTAIRWFFILFAAGMLLLAAPKRRKALVAGVGVIVLTGLGFAAWSLNHYMPTISPTWSQGPLWETYYTMCTRVEGPRGAHPMKRYCVESAISYKLNWRGETYYTQNEVIPVRDDDEWNFFLEQNDGRCFYAIMERARLPAFRSALPTGQRETIEEVHTENIKFILVRANCADPEAEEAEEGSGDTEE